MMLFVENLEKGGVLELAMLLDESPSPKYRRGGPSTREPWAPNGALYNASKEAQLYGRATLHIVFSSEDVGTWGRRTVHALVGGLLFDPTRPAVPLRYEVVNRNVYGNITGCDSKMGYRVIASGNLGHDPVKGGVGEKIRRAGCHKHLGYQEAGSGWPRNPQSSSAEPILSEPLANTAELGDSASLRTGFYLNRVDNTGYSEQWFVADVDGFLEFRFEMQEFSRRRYVRAILGILGFTAIEGVATRASLPQEKASALLCGVLPQLLALERLCSGPANFECSAPVKAEPVEEVPHSTSKSKQLAKTNGVDASAPFQSSAAANCQKPPSAVPQSTQPHEAFPQKVGIVAGVALLRRKEPREEITDIARNPKRRKIGSDAPSKPDENNDIEVTASPEAIVIDLSD